jgi:SNF2 family DNA or RNA helicase
MAVAHVNAKHKVFVLPYDAGIANVVPGCKHVALPAGPAVIVPHTRDAVRFARNLGHRVPAPILSQYGWNGDTPFKAQKITAALMTMHDRAFILSEIGTGKTRAACYAIDYLLKSGEISAACIVAPLSTLVRVWELEFFRYFSHLNVQVLHGSREKRIERLKAGADVFIINFDGVETILPALQEAKQIGAIVIDELSYYRNSQTDMWKAAKDFTVGRKYVWGMTGSPTPNEPTDAYGQVKLLLPNRVPKYFNRFQALTMRRLSQFRWIAQPNALDIVYDTMQPAVRFLRKDVAELPETSYQTREVDLSVEQAKVYKALAAKAHHAFAQGEVTALNEAVLLSKLLQVASGWVYTTTRGTVALDNRGRMDALHEVLLENGGKTIVFVEFIHAATALHAALVAGGWSVELITGSVSLSQRNQVFARFQDSPTPRILVAHPRCMSHGLTLTAANTVVWFTPTASLETYIQANGRITRPGQKDKTLVVHLCASAVEYRIYSRLQRKAKVQGTLLEMFETNQAV